ncbi:MAG: hypothetical protein ACREJX_01635 [Polyangiaceae bacterium]
MTYAVKNRGVWKVRFEFLRACSRFIHLSEINERLDQNDVTLLCE